MAVEPLVGEIRPESSSTTASSRAAPHKPSATLRAVCLGLARTLDRLAPHRTCRGLTLAGVELVLALASALAAIAIGVTQHERPRRPPVQRTSGQQAVSGF